MKLQDLQNLPLEKRIKIVYAVVLFFAVIFFSLWMNDLMKRMQAYDDKYKSEKVINSTQNYSESLEKAKHIMDKVNNQMKEDLEKYDPEIKLLEQAASSSIQNNATNSTSSIIKDENNIQ